MKKGRIITLVVLLSLVVLSVALYRACRETGALPQPEAEQAEGQVEAVPPHGRPVPEGIALTPFA